MIVIAVGRGFDNKLLVQHAILCKQAEGCYLHDNVSLTETDDLVLYWNKSYDNMEEETKLKILFPIKFEVIYHVIVSGAA